jgi:hypothetical protein
MKSSCLISQCQTDVMNDKNGKCDIHVDTTEPRPQFSLARKYVMGQSKVAQCWLV